MDLGQLAKSLTPYLLPELRDTLVQVARSAVQQSNNRTLRARVEPGYVLSHDPTTGRATVALDTDQEETNVRAVGVYPLNEGDRVVVLFAPPHGGYIIGNGQGTPVAPIVGSDGEGSVVAGGAGLTEVGGVTGLDLHRGVQVQYRVVVEATKDATAGEVGVEGSVSLDGGVTWAGAARFRSYVGAGQRLTIPTLASLGGVPAGVIVGRLRVESAAGSVTVSRARHEMLLLPFYDYPTPT